MITTIVLLVSRRFLLTKLFDRLEELDCQVSKTNLFCIVDGDLDLFLYTKKLVEQSKFAERLCIRSNNRSKRSKSQHYRRKRIADLHNEAKQYLQVCDYVLLIEDDGIIPIDTLVRLQAIYKKHPSAGFVTGLELGRWLTPYVGGWKVDDPSNPGEIQSIELPSKKDIVEVDGAGLYASLVKLKHYEQHEFRPDPNFGPDIVFGFALSAKGLKNYMDTTLVVDHYRENGSVVNLETTVPRKTHMKKLNGIWRFQHSVRRVNK